MVINDLHIECIAFQPDKTDLPLIIDANRILALTLALQRLQSVTGRFREFGQTANLIKILQLSSRGTFDSSKSWNVDIVEQGAREFIPE